MIELIRVVSRVVLGPVLEKLAALYFKLLPRNPGIEPSSIKDNSTLFPIDIVYTWVDGSDPEWRKIKESFTPDVSTEPSYNYLSSHDSRYDNKDELLYSLRSIAKYAPFINHIYIVTANQTPLWLNNRHQKITVVSHSEIFKESSCLPTFNSNAIESQLHHIPGLEEHFIYFNDDVFLGRYCDYLDYFDHNGNSIAYLTNKAIDNDPPKHDENGLVWSIKNAQSLLSEKHGQSPRQKQLHMPFSLQKSLLFELENQFPDAFNNTQCHRFRHMDDVGIVTSLHHSYANLTGRGIHKHYGSHNYKHRYINLGSPFLRPVLKMTLHTKEFHSFCINESVHPIIGKERINRVAQSFLEAYFPDKCEFEL